MITVAALHRFSVQDFHRMGETGILGEDDRVELIEGEIVEMTPIGARHAACVNRLNRVLTQRLGAEGIVGVQNPIVLGEHDEPQPDVVVLRPREDFYAAAHPRAGDVLLLVEVADTSREYDRVVKLPLYARHGIPEVWLVDLSAEAVETYREPREGTYEVTGSALRGHVVRPSGFPGLAITVAEVLGS